MSDYELCALLRRFDTPTICNAIEVAEGKRGFDRFTRGTVLAADRAHAPICGRAITARLRGRTPPDEPPEAIRARRMAYYRSVAGGPRPAVVVVEDADWPECVGAYWGEINVAVHKGFGVDGVLTNGVMRDLDALDPGFQVLAGSVGPSHGFVHLLEIGAPVAVFGLELIPGELVHADRHGGVVIPEALIPDLPAAIEKLVAGERLILDPARADGFDFASFEAAWTAFENART